MQRKHLAIAAVALISALVVGCGSEPDDGGYPAPCETVVQEAQESAPVEENYGNGEEKENVGDILDEFDVGWNKVEPEDEDVPSKEEQEEFYTNYNEKEEFSALTEEQLTETDALGRTVREVRDDFISKGYSFEDAETAAYFAVTGKNLWVEE